MRYEEYNNKIESLREKVVKDILTYKNIEVNIPVQTDTFGVVLCAFVREKGFENTTNRVFPFSALSLTQLVNTLKLLEFKA